MPGPAPTPTSILKARGSWRAKTRDDEPKPILGAPKCPRDLPAAAKIIWRRVIRTIAPGVLSLDHEQLLIRYCRGVVRWSNLQEWLDANEHVYMHNGLWRIHPKVKLADSLAEQLLRSEQEFGITPAARSRIRALPDKQSYDDKARFFNPALRIAE